MRCVTATYPGGQDTAHLVLAAEGVEHEQREVAGELGYGRLLAELWVSGEGFVIVEHDVAPWVGAIDQLAGCESDWCIFHYPKFGGMLTRGLGCTKFSTRLVNGHPELSEAWQGIGWQVLDGTVGAAVADVLRKAQPDRHPLCYHNPPVGHARRADD